VRASETAELHCGYCGALLLDVRAATLQFERPERRCEAALLLGQLGPCGAASLLAATLEDLPVRATCAQALVARRRLQLEDGRGISRPALAELLFRSEQRALCAALT
jgi:hypothetical protein